MTVCVIHEISSFRIAQYSGIKVSVFPVPDTASTIAEPPKGITVQEGVVYGGVSPPSDWQRKG